MRSLARIHFDVIADVVAVAAQISEVGERKYRSGQVADLDDEGVGGSPTVGALKARRATVGTNPIRSEERRVGKECRL